MMALMRLGRIAENGSRADLMMTYGSWHRRRTRAVHLIHRHCQNRLDVARSGSVNLRCRVPPRTAFLWGFWTWSLHRDLIWCYRVLIEGGGNLDDHITYSGTVAAAMEGTLQGIPSIAFSRYTVRRDRAKWTTAERYAPDLINRLVSIGWASDV